jgi:hypothetical protein
MVKKLSKSLESNQANEHELTTNESNIKKLLKETVIIAMKTLKNLKEKVENPQSHELERENNDEIVHSQEPINNLTAQKDETDETDNQKNHRYLQKLNNIFEILAKYIPDIKFNTNEKTSSGKTLIYPLYSISYDFNINHQNQSLLDNLLNLFVNIEKTYASLTIKNEITYGNLFEFFNNYDDIILFYNYIKNNHNIKFYQNYLEYNINIFINVFKKSFNIKNQQGPVRIVQIQELIVSKQVDVYLAFEKMIVNIINLLENYETDLINKAKLKNILDELSKIDIKPTIYFFGGGNLNEELKINFLNTGKYKELQKNNETIPSELEEYKNKYQNNDEYDDMNKIGQLSDDIDVLHSIADRLDQACRRSGLQKGTVRVVGDKISINLRAK